MGDSDCGGCKKREENIYWSHFQTVQFFQILSGHYDLQLAIPQKFADNLREKLADSVSLKGPCGAIWNVDLEADGDKLYLKYGWKEFVEEHSLRENDVLVFKYNGNLQFDVTMFDGLTLCEKEASYFIRHCEHRELTIRAITNGTATPISYHDAAANESSHEEFEVTARENLRKGYASIQQSTQAYGRPRKRPKSGSGGPSHVYPLQLKSNRRPVTEDEKGKAIQAASAAAVGDSFTVIMQECHVYKGFFLTIPAEWARSHLPQKNINVSLHVNEKTWLAKCYYKTSSHGLAGSGWKNFALDNFLEKDDACVFSLVSQSDNSVIFNVRIFRVVEEVVAPNRVIGTPSRKSMQPT